MRSYEHPIFCSQNGFTHRNRPFWSEEFTIRTSSDSTPPFAQYEQRGPCAHLPRHGGSSSARSILTFHAPYGFWGALRTSQQASYGAYSQPQGRGRPLCADAAGPQDPHDPHGPRLKPLKPWRNPISALLKLRSRSRSPNGCGRRVGTGVSPGRTSLKARHRRHHEQEQQATSEAPTSAADAGESWQGCATSDQGALAP